MTSTFGFTWPVYRSVSLFFVSQLVGVVAIQGDFERHIRSVEQLGKRAQEVRTPEDLAHVDRVIIPGGESTTVGMLMERVGLGAALIERAADGMPIWGTCMGMILLAREVVGRSPYRLGLLDITVQRNAFGAQVHSFEAELNFDAFDSPVQAVFIRAPIVTQWGDAVEVLAEFDQKVVAVRQNQILGTSFHPELTQDLRIHEWFCNF